jgi:hypothetical protein
MPKPHAFKAIAVTVLAAALLFGATAANALQRDDPRDPITRIVKYIRHVFVVITHDDGASPPKP